MVDGHLGTRRLRAEGGGRAKVSGVYRPQAAMERRAQEVKQQQAEEEEDESVGHESVPMVMPCAQPHEAVALPPSPPPQPPPTGDPVLELGDEMRRALGLGMDPTLAESAAGAATGEAAGEAAATVGRGENRGEGRRRRRRRGKGKGWDDDGQNGGSGGQAPAAARDALVSAESLAHQGRGRATTIDTPPPGGSIVLDVSYSWPSEKRPAKERQRAVVAQVRNFLECATPADGAGSEPLLYVCGAGVREIRAQLEELGSAVAVSEQDIVSLAGGDGGGGGGGAADVDDGSGGDSFNGAGAHEIADSNVRFLSPDADEWLDADKGYPAFVFVVGALVDRKVKRGRSKLRAEKTGIRAIQLPLSDGSDSDNPPDGTPLNIDTVLCMLHYWRIISESAPSAADGTPLPPAAHWLAAKRAAIEEHRRRHPNQGEHSLGLEGGRGV